MNLFSSQDTNAIIRPVQYRDMEALEQLLIEASEADNNSDAPEMQQQLQRVRHWYWLLKVLSLFPNPFQYEFYAQVLQQAQSIRGMIQVAPFNRTRSTWQVDGVVVAPQVSRLGVGSKLLRHCFETILEARTWLLEVNINNQAELALYRQNGFQPLAEVTYWAIAPELLQELQEREPDLPNLLPVSNADAQLLYQLDTAAMPPLVRQVFDRHIQDFKSSFFTALVEGMRQWFNQTEVVSGYVFETQRKAAIGYFQLQLSRKGQKHHVAQLTVHPAYTWLYPELLAQMARLTQDFPAQALQIVSADYQPEREEYLEQLGAERIKHTLLMSRSVWHKLRETRPISFESLPEMLQGLQPARKPVLGRMSWLKSRNLRSPKDASTDTSSSPLGSGGARQESVPEHLPGIAFKISRPSSNSPSPQIDCSDIQQEGPPC